MNLLPAEANAKGPALRDGVRKSRQRPRLLRSCPDLALDEVQRLLEEGASEQDILTILEIEQRALENGVKENYYWLVRILRSYQARVYSGDVGTYFQVLVGVAAFAVLALTLWRFSRSTFKTCRAERLALAVL